MASGSSDLAADLARRVRAARTLSGKKAPELARECGWQTDKLYRIEQGRQEPLALDILALAQATGQSIEFFYFGTAASPIVVDAVDRDIDDSRPAVKAKAAGAR
jgi:transcriptional regulator with XRE-family HTH domain